MIANDVERREATTTTTMTTMRARERGLRDGFIKNFDHRQMGSRMEALVYRGTHDEERRETEKMKEREKRDGDTVRRDIVTYRLI